MPEILEVAQFAQDDAVANVQIRPARVTPEFHHERFTRILSFPKFLLQLFFGNNFTHPATDNLHLFTNRRKIRHHTRRLSFSSRSIARS